MLKVCFFPFLAVLFLFCLFFNHIFLSYCCPLTSSQGVAINVFLVKELVHAFSCAYIELCMHLGSLESTQEARVGLETLALLLCSPNFSRASIRTNIHMLSMSEPIFN